ncbi:MAG: HAD-IC family P-type ATPase [Candidatus Pacebacteria bacterium]|nr:HAD-IC family P-type ATPase [Candidatus Paceibacterota bacterium]MBP9852291.1 HAD-IC family P-type ATPase [Candidatus Paceibacterota bacterium]
MKSLNPTKTFWNITPEATATFFETDIEKGLSGAVVKERLNAFGKNTISTSKRTSGLKIFFNQLKSPLIVVLIAAGIITLAISHYRDAIFIFVAVFVNSALGFYQENKAERALAELKTYLKQRARIIRGGKEHTIDAEDLVPGDIIKLAQGDRVPADARIISVNDFQVDEAVLTGESLPVVKDSNNAPDAAGLSDQSSMVFAGTLVTQGICTAIVCFTGKSTELGQIASLIAHSEHEKTPLQKAIINFSIYSSIVLGLLTLVVFIVGIMVGYSPLDMFLTSVAIAVSAIPEGLPISMTVILAVGVERMAKRKGVVRKLVAAEALGSTTLILTDKTGTLTMAKMVMSQIIPAASEVGGTVVDEETLIERALTNANVLIENPNDNPESWRINGRIMEIALVRSAALRGLTLAEITKKEHVIDSLPFNAVKKFSVSLVKENGEAAGKDGGHKLVFFGAPDILLGFSSLADTEKEKMLAQIETLAQSGERVLGVASFAIADAKDFSLATDIPESGISFNGLITFRDPIRSGIKHAIKRVRDAGVKTVILTGDHRGTAMAVAREIGMTITDKSVLDASELSKLSEKELRKRLPKLAVISRVTPFDKLRIAKLYQDMGEVVAMTGDGVNDAPSIKQADVGIAMGSGTEVAQSVADLVLLDDNFETIVAAIEEGRQILGNIRKVLVYLLSNVTDGLILIGGSLLTGLPLPLNALQILWVNFFTDSFPAVSYAFEKEPDGLKHKPLKRGNIKLFDPVMKFLILAIGIVTSAMLFVLYYILMKKGFDETTVRTFIFAAFGTYTLLVALSVRSLEKSILSYPLFSNRYLNIGIIFGLVLMAVAIYWPPLQGVFDTVSLPIEWIGGVALVGIANIVLIEVAKWFFRMRRIQK